MLRVKNIKKSYKTGDFNQDALKGVSIDFRENEFVSILGASGSGKTTLLNIIGGLDRYDSGDLIINNKSTKQFKNKDWDAYRNNCIGFIFQSYNLISHISILANVEMGLILSGKSKKYAKRKAKELLTKVGLKDHAHKKPNQLSGGQMQRVAIARALANDPEIILADEPTGALDSKTSVQIMKLIKEIAKDKLVIMVTHNPDLAKEYSTRIIELKDGELVSDSNPISKDEKDNKDITIKKTKMSFLTALNLSFNNIKTKKGRTFLTAFASSIGIIGIALILALSNGFKIQIDKFEKDTLSQMPIIITQQVAVMDEDATNSFIDQMKVTDESYSNSKKIHAIKDQTSIMHTNKIDLDYIEYLEELDQDLIGGVSYMRTINMNLLHKNVTTGKIELMPQSATQPILFPLPENFDGSKGQVIEDNFELIYGKEPENYNELLLLIDINNGLDENFFKTFGFDTSKEISFDDMLNLEFQIVLDNDFYTQYGNQFAPAQDYESLYNNKNNITLKIVGIIRGKEGSKFAQYSGNGITYKESLVDYVLDKNKDSKIVKAQESSNYNVLTGEKFDTSSAEGILAKENTLAYVGGTTAPYTVQLYPKDFKSKDKVLKHLDAFNEGKEEEDKIIYTDMAAAISSLSNGIMDGITIVLIAFSSISLVVSSIMIGIIMYISVLERTKEIGILKALGARNKDVTRVFNAETFIIGMASGIIGLLIANILCIPISIVIEKITTLQNVAQLRISHELILLFISVTLTLIGGFIPAKIASKKDPVNALRTE
ncbi:MAG: ATP-binding cassette domain-containing protein [Bacilli bacterium]|nr:ATP-binding cassette domain-containing protein [Bacilli bacterium]